MGIQLTNKSKAKATTKVLQSLVSYMFEQEYDELSKASSKEKQVLEDACNTLKSIIKKHNG